MIFKRLALKNFMSYENAEIDFSGVHISCLVGENGAGKTSLLDAITWTLWEEGRAKTDELIKLGQDEMSCELEFFMEDELYRVYRARLKGFKNSQGKSNLEFQIYNSKEKIWISLSKNTTRLTQDLITETLKMDHRTFVNSVYLRQGKADEFTVKKPNERKQILADILGLEIYDKLCEATRSKIREIEQNILLGQNLIALLKEKITKEDGINLNLNSVSEKLKIDEIEIKKIKTLLQVKEKELNEKKEKERQIETLEKSLENQKSLIDTLQEQLKNIKDKKAKCAELLSKKSEINCKYENYLSIRKEFDVLETNKCKHDELIFKRNSLEMELKEKISDIEKDLAVYKSKISDRNNQKNKLSKMLNNENLFKDFLPRAEEKVIREFYKLRESLTSIDSSIRDQKHEKEVILMDLKTVEEKKSEIRKKIQALSSHNHSEPCPLCKNPIKDKESIVKSYEHDLTNCEQKILEFKERIKIKDIEIAGRCDKYNKTKDKVDNFAKDVLLHLQELELIRCRKIELDGIMDGTRAVSFFESQLAASRIEFEKTKEQIAVYDREIDNYNNEIKSLNNLRTSGDIVSNLSAKLNTLSSELKELNHDQKKYEELRKEIKETEGIILRYNLLLQAESEEKQLLAEEESLTFKVNTGRNELGKLSGLIIENKKQIQDILILSNEIQEIRQKEHEMENSIAEIRKQLVIFEQALADITDAKLQLEEKENKIKILLEDKKHYEILEKAFSKNGIQVAIIETVVPEIEKEANKILNRLTDNQMHVALKTQREKKTAGGMVETLDVLIADNLGSRNYELYSGGEAFKIDFSIRLALSKLLANRAGAKLQSLIIDEGFGSQDTSGRERLIEVIRSIQNDFELIMVVTHIDELKESFPVQIHVSKGERGSKVKLIA